MGQILGEEVEITDQQSSFVQFCQNMAEPTKSGRLNQSIADMESEYFSKLELETVEKPNLVNLNIEILQQL
jgi:hypothetical protein